MAIAQFVILVLVAGAAALAGLVSLVALPAWPLNRAVRATWLCSLLTALGGFVWLGILAPADPMVFWEAPPWHPAVAAVALILVPFGASALLWRMRSRTPERIGPGVAMILVALILTASVLSFKIFNRSCVYYDYWHDDGEPWCPAAWRATL